MAEECPTAKEAAERLGTSLEGSTRAHGMVKTGHRRYCSDRVIALPGEIGTYLSVRQPDATPDGLA